MSRFEPAAGLDALIARRVLAPNVDAVKRAVERSARRRAPGAKVWITADDERVRPTHVEADGQEIPANLRFILSVPGRRGEPTGQSELGRVPRDEDLSAANRMECRCASVPVPGAIARRIHAGPTIVSGTSVRARVTGEFHRIVESEHGTSGDQAARFMGAAADEARARLRATGRR